MPITHRFGCIIPAGGNPTTSPAQTGTTGICGRCSHGLQRQREYPPWSLIAGVANVELVEATGTITLTLPPATAIAGGFREIVRFIDMATGTVTIGDSGSFT